MLRFKQTIIPSERPDLEKLYDQIKALDYGVYKVIVYDQRPEKSEVKRVGVGVSSLNVAEMREFIEIISHWAHTELGCEIPSPDDVPAQELYEEA